ncbi:MAG TPA: GGDEF domain-containing protein [Acidimicrobiales bacterium]|nr:GGDEF domain-containing protein [Acidimicrobiales bacterium]
MAREPEGVAPPSVGEVREVHAAEMRASTRTTGLVGGVIILVAMPLWAIYDQVVAPEVAGRFLTVRLLSLLPVLVAWLLLRREPFGERHAEVLAACGFATPQLVIAWMLPQADQGFDGYLLGFSLVIYGSAFLLVARLHVTIVLIAASWLATATSYTLQRDGIDRVELTTTVFYLGTASLLAAVGRFLRMRLEREALAARLALEAEQARTLELVGELDRLSREDSLTRVANRRAWDEALHRACAEAERTGAPLAVLLLDIDRFKHINDEYGHRRGDEVLQEVSGSLRRRVRGADLLARVGGDEFAVLCPNTGPEEARHLAGELTLLVAAMPGDLSVSVGSAVHWPGCDPEALMGLADRRLYDQKRSRPPVTAQVTV